MLTLFRTSRLSPLRSALATACLSACLVPVVSTVSTAQTTPTPSAARRGGELAYGERFDISLFNPYTLPFSDAPTDRFLSMIYEPLFRWNFQDGAPEPVLASKLTSVSPAASAKGGVSYLIELKKGVKWHDDTPFTAADVVFTWNFVMAMGQNKFQRDGINEVIANVSMPTPSNPLLVRIDFRKTVAEPAAYLDFPIIPASRFVMPTYGPADRSRPLANYPIGTGPFKQQAGNGSVTALVANANYHAEPAKLGSVRANEYRDVATMVEDFVTQNGPINLIVQVPDLQLRRVEGSKRSVRVERLETYKVHAIALRQRSGSPLTNVKVRRAITMAVNREQIRENWFAGRGSVLASPFTTGSSFFDPTLEPLPFDVEASKAELKASGTTLRPLRLIYKSSDVGTPSLESDLARTIEQSLAAIGIKVITQPLLPNDYQRNLFGETASDNTNWDMAVALMEFNPTQDLAGFFHSRNIKSGGSNYLRYNNPTFDGLLNEADEAEDASRKIALLKRAARILRDEAPAVFLVNEETAFATTNDLIMPEGTRDSFYFFTYANLWRFSSRSGR